MRTYTEYCFHTTDESVQETLAVLLEELGFEGFEFTTSNLRGYVDETTVTAVGVQSFLDEHQLSSITFSSKAIAPKNWNEAWEKSFEPVVWEDKIGVRAPFHEPLNTAIELIIEPKMSFGTGHHDTTRLMMQLMHEMDFHQKTVFDFGSGTGILSILAEKMGAAVVNGIDNEAWAVENAQENFARNACIRCQTVLNDGSMLAHVKCDVLLANINRHVILNHLSLLEQALNKGGQLLLSGFLLNDEGAISPVLEKLFLKQTGRMISNGWLALRYTKP